jgi:serine/threonine protein kinase
MEEKKIKICTVRAEVLNEKGEIEYFLKPVKPLGKGTFSHVDLFERKFPDGKKDHVAMKRPNHKNLNFMKEAVFQDTLHRKLKQYGLSFCVAEVYDIIQFQQSKLISFLMECFEPVFLDRWLELQFQKQKDTRYFVAKFLLQIALILEVFEERLHIDHRDIKTNNMIVLESPVHIDIKWKEKRKTIDFPFRIVFLDFGYACRGEKDENSKIPPIDPCPKLGRDFYQVLACLWNIKILRYYLEAASWGKWIRERLESCMPNHGLHKIEGSKDLSWLVDATDLQHFVAPLCAPSVVINDCLTILEEYESS